MPAPRILVLSAPQLPRNARKIAASSRTTPQRAPSGPRSKKSAKENARAIKLKKRLGERTRHLIKTQKLKALSKGARRLFLLRTFFTHYRKDCLKNNTKIPQHAPIFHIKQIHPKPRTKASIAAPINLPKPRNSRLYI